MKELIRIVSIMLKEKRDVLLSIIFGSIAGLTAVGLFAANGYLISQAALTPPLYILIGMVAVVKLGSLLRATSRYGERYYSHRATFTMLSDLRVHFFEKLEKMPLPDIQRYRSGDLLSRIVGDVESLQNFFLRVLYPPIIMVTVFIGTIMFVSFYTVEIVIILIIGLMLTGFLIPAWFAIKQRKLSGEILNTRANFSTETTEWFKGYRDLKIHRQLLEKEQQLISASDAYIEQQENLGKRSNINHSINLAVSFLIFWTVVAVSGYLVASGQLDGLFFAMVVMISLTLFDHSTPMATLPIYYEESERAAIRLESVIDSPKIKSKKQRGEGNFKNPPSITLEHVSFSFPGESREVIKDINLHFPSGSKTAIVGPSGSGKSTVLNLLLQLHDVTKGTIKYEDINLKDLDQEQLWKQAKVVLQENHFFAGTIRDNLLLEADFMTDEEIKQLLFDVQLSQFTPSTEVFENGENLSGGEKQRLAMARAIVKKGNIWLLDEPTSSLDSWTANRIYNELYRRATNDTVILVSHQLAGLEKMDQIVVMDQGKIVEVGNYEALMEKKGYFYKLKKIEENIISS
ncbi:thiol reductant ABC exporter subunit CydC [Lottiidibacillus patelloidae]|uniref:Thiol reductant ABC exporter subunit CydC n=1 Tax=Lottiidibacillus patelloidae TaxID=2670334 RepID=A0A263BW37_9BACI|nr:thiol reductant ABC exporter subunit CydC [Lottiidibacillus patelloidae]OZM57396.1 thiol reductant ABC exporter subunit CydC [Lottiidibacillus patelloidae]